MTREEKEQWDIFMQIWIIPALKNTWGEKKCKEIVEALEEWEKQGSVLDKIRAEIEKLEYLNIEDGSDGYDKYIEQYEALRIIDKYKAESEGV